MVASALSTSQTRRQLQDELSVMKRRNAQTRGGAAALGMRLDALAQRGFRVPAEALNARDIMFRLVGEMDRLEAGMDEVVVSYARREERLGNVAPGTVDNILRRGVGEPISLLLAGTIVACLAVVGTLIYAMWSEHLARKPAIIAATNNAAAQQLIVGPMVNAYERQLAALPPGAPIPPPPSIPTTPNAPQQPGFGTEIAKATGGLALLLAVGAGIFILAGRR